MTQDSIRFDDPDVDSDVRAIRDTLTEGILQGGLSFDRVEKQMGEEDMFSVYYKDDVVADLGTEYGESLLRAGFAVVGVHRYGGNDYLSIKKLD